MQVFLLFSLISLVRRVVVVSKGKLEMDRE